MNDTSVEIAIPNKILLRPDEVADIFGVSVPTVYNWKNTGLLPCVKRLGKPLRFKREDIIQLLSESE